MQKNELSKPKRKLSRKVKAKRVVKGFFSPSKEDALRIARNLMNVYVRDGKRLGKYYFDERLDLEEFKKRRKLVLLPLDQKLRENSLRFGASWALDCLGEFNSKKRKKVVDFVLGADRRITVNMTKNGLSFVGRQLNSNLKQELGSYKKVFLFNVLLRIKTLIIGNRIFIH